MGMLIQYLFCLYQAASRFLDSQKVLWAHLVLKKLSSCLKTSTLGDLPRDSPTTGSTWKIWAPWSSPKSSPAPWKRPSVLWFLDQNWSISNAKHTHVVFFWGRRIFAGGKNTFTIFENPPEIHFPDPWSSVFHQIPQGKIQCSPQGTML